ncbi:MAG: glycosyltransferase [Gemmatimonadota bacterium]|nr:MAG: glycosyltransferase [Gemmatimonadota bacterium]
MRRVDTVPRSIRDYGGLIGEGAVAEIEALAAPLRGSRVLHLNATAYGGGVAEMLPTLVSLSRGLGIEAEWHVLEAENDFFDLTKRLHNGLQGMEVEILPTDRSLYLSTLERNMQVFQRDWDFVVVHDPQPVGLLGLLDGRRTGRWIWRCHIDTSTPGNAAIDFLAPFMGYFELAVYSMPGYVTPRLGNMRTEFVFPSINPLTPKNEPLSPALARQILACRFGISNAQPLIVQVSRFDPWKDPLGVIDSYRQAKRRIKDVQLALAGNIADDDPEGIEYHARTLEHAAGDPDIHVLSTLDRLSRDELTHALEINAFQSGADVVVQKSTREGFGLVVAEAMWKRTPVVGGRVGGIVEQIEDGVNGYLVTSVEECADRVVELLKSPRRRREMGERARETVRERFLTPRHLSDYLRIFRSLA